MWIVVILVIYIAIKVTFPTKIKEVGQTEDQEF